MNWAPVLYAWACFVYLIALALLGIQFSSELLPSFRAGARGLVLLLGISLCLFAVVAEYFHISLWWGVLVLPIVDTLAFLLFLRISSVLKRKIRNR